PTPSPRPTLVVRPKPALRIVEKPKARIAVTVTPTESVSHRTWAEPRLVDLPVSVEKKPPVEEAPALTPQPNLDQAQTIVFDAPPAKIFVTFAGGPGRYQLEVVDEGGNHLKTLFDKRVVAGGELWLEWAGKND